MLMDNSRNAAGYASNEAITNTAQRFKIQQLNMTQNISEAVFQTQP